MDAVFDPETRGRDNRRTGSFVCCLKSLGLPPSHGSMPASKHRHSLISGLAPKLAPEKMPTRNGLVHKGTAQQF
jgi:hypothetical protein